METVRIKLLNDMGYSDKAIKLITEKKHLREMENPTLKTRHEGNCGDVILLYLKVENAIITDASYEFVGCAGLQSTGSALVELILGKKLGELSNFKAQDIIDYLEHIPDAKHDCAEIAEGALHKALAELK